MNIQEQIEQAKFLIKSNNMEDAINLLENLKKNKSFNFDIFFELGKAYYVLKNNKKAYDNLKISCEIQEDNIYSKILLAKCLKALNKNIEAIKIFRKLEETEIEEETKIEIVRILTSLKRYKTAYRYIIKKFKKQQYCSYFKDIKDVAFELINIGENRKALRLFKKLEETGIEEEIKIEIIKILANNQQYILLCRYIMVNFKDQYYSYLNHYIFNEVLGKLSDVKLVELEKVYWYLLKKIDSDKILDIEIRLTKLYCFRNLNFVNKSKFMALIYNKIYKSSNIILKKFYNKTLNLLEQKYNIVNIKSLPQNLSIQLTSKCNAKCKFCNIYKKEWELPSNIYNEILSLLPTLIKVDWLGGEVFLYKYFKELFIKAKECNVRQEIITNAMLLTKEWINKFINSNVNLAISIRSTEKDKYEYLTQGASFDKLILKLEYLKKQLYKKNEKFTLSMFVLVTKYNYMELETFIDFAYNYNFDLVRFIQLDNIKNSPKSYDICNPKSEIYSELVKFFNKAVILANKYKIKIKNELPLDIKNKEIIENEKISYCKKNLYAYEIENYMLDIENICNISNLFCVWPWEQFQIDSDGDIFFNCFCDRTKKIFGNIKEQTILGLWNSEKVVKFRRKIIDNNCKNICNKMCIVNNVHRKDIV